MHHSSSSSLESPKFNTSSDQEDLIPGLPDDLALRCLELLALSLPRRRHALLRCVSTRWRRFWSSHRCVTLRQTHGTAEGWLYALSRDKSERLHWHALDPTARRWVPLPPMPHGHSKYGLACATLRHNLYVMGGCDKYEDPSRQVLVYDALANSWSAAPDMQRARCHFVCAALHGRLYAVGGMGLKSGALNSWEVLGEDGRWSLFDDPNVVSDLGESLVLDGRIYVRHVSPNVIPPSYVMPTPYAAVYDPRTNEWETLHNQMTLQWYGPAVTVGDEQVVCMLDQNIGIKLMVLNREVNEWCTLGRLSPRSIATPCRIAAIGKSLYVVGRGLRTIVLDLEKAGINRGMLVTSSIPGVESTADDIVLSCNVIEL